MDVPRAGLRHDFGVAAGSITYYFVDGTDHPYYGAECRFCARQVYSGHVVGVLRAKAMVHGDVICRRCMETMLELAPADARMEKVEKIRAESALVDWIREPNGSME